MEQEKPAVNGTYLLEKFPGKGGWTYAAIPEIKPNKNAPFGWVKVRGRIDSVELKQYKLMPMGNGQLFLPVKAAIRKKIGKQAGDFVEVVLYPDHSALEIPEEILSCFEHEPPAVYETFKAFTEGERKAYLDWIYAAKQEETKAQRILTMMNRLARQQRWHDKTE